MTNTRIDHLRRELKELYDQNADKLLFHGWHHVTFVSKKAATFAEELGLDTELLEATGLVHDLNYIVKPNSEPEIARDIRKKYLVDANYTPAEIETIEQTIMEAHTATRHAGISDNAKALSDADTLFKALPITPIVFAGHFITENHIDINELANKVVSEQQPLFESGIYFYTESAKAKYLHWAESNLQLWINVKEALADQDVKELLIIAKESGAV